MISSEKSNTNINRYKKINLFYGINVFCAIIFMIWYNVPLLRITFSGGYYNIAILFIIGLWLMTSLIIAPYWILRMPAYLYWISVWLFYILFLAILGIGSDIRSHLQLLLSWWFVAFFSFFYLVYSNKRSLFKIFKITLFCIFLTTITTLYGVSQYPNAAKTMINRNMDIENYNLFVKMNIGGYDLINGLLLLIPILIIIFKLSKKNFKIRFFTFVFLGLIIATILKASYATTALLMLPILTTSLFLKNKVKTVFIINVLIFIFIITFINQFADWLINFAHLTGNTTLIKRFSEVAMFFNGEIADGSPKYRLMALSNSWNTFLENPFSGVGGIYYSDLNAIGAHSQWLDDLGRYGLIGAVPSLLFISFYIKFLYKKFHKEPYFGVYLFSIFIVFLLGWINPITSAPTIATVFFFLIPVFGVWIDEKRKRSTE
jgi:hypothetical protein